ncbi:phosphatidylinositol 3-kinase C2 domain-containing subunit gamma [Gastrophryne carolinensis]
MTGTAGPHHMTGTAGPHHMTGTAGPHHMTGTAGPHHMTGTADPYHMTGTAAPNQFPPAPHPMAAPRVSYGFITNNWIEEQSSWYPEPPSAPPGEDLAPNPAPPDPVGLGGFRIGFENFADTTVTDPTGHYHCIGHHGDAHPPTGGNPGALVRSRTVDEYRIHLQEISSNTDPAFSAFCQAVAQIRKGFDASDPASNSGRLWSVAAPFPEQAEDSEVDVSIYVENLQTPLLLLCRDSILVEDLIGQVVGQLPRPSGPPSLYPSLQTLYTANRIALDDQTSRPPPSAPERPSSGLYPSLEDLPPQSPRATNLLRICGRDDYLQRIRGVGGLLEAVKEICYLLRSVETQEISDGVRNVRIACYPPPQSLCNNLLYMSQSVCDTLLYMSQSLCITLLYMSQSLCNNLLYMSQSLCNTLLYMSQSLCITLLYMSQSLCNNLLYMSQSLCITLLYMSQSLCITLLYMSQSLCNNLLYMSQSVCDTLLYMSQSLRITLLYMSRSLCITLLYMSQSLCITLLYTSKSLCNILLYMNQSLCNTLLYMSQSLCNTLLYMSQSLCNILLYMSQSLCNTLLYMSQPLCNNLLYMSQSVCDTLLYMSQSLCITLLYMSQSLCNNHLYMSQSLCNTLLYMSQSLCITLLYMSQSLCNNLLYMSQSSWTKLLPPKSPAQEAAAQLSLAISRLINIYSRSFRTDFEARIPNEVCRPIAASDHLTFHLYAAHNLPDNWAKSDNVFHVSCSVTYSGRKICPEVTTSNMAASHSFFSRLMWDQVITFPLPLAALPYETMLVLRLCASNPASNPPAFLAWSCLPLYSQQQIVRGTLLLNMMSHAEPPPIISPGAFSVTLPTLITIQLDFPETHHIFRRPDPEAFLHNSHVAPQAPAQQLELLLQRDSVLLLSESDKQCLWHYRHCANKPPKLLPFLLGSAPGWDPQSLAAVYGLLQNWTFSEPLEGLALLSSCFSDERIREEACRQIAKLSDDALWVFLPQLVQALKLDWRLDSALVKLLLQRSLRSIQIAHRLFWLLTDATNESHYRSFYQTLLAALQCCGGSALNAHFSQQGRLMRILQGAGESVQNCAEEERQETLQTGLQKLERFFQEEKSCRLPLDPAILLRGISIERCSYFRSNTRPLKIAFLNADPEGPDVHVIYKAGDDIRQDALILQIIRLLDSIWLHEGLDLRMVTYTCLPTGKKQGLIQMVPDSTTLAKIQNRGGLFGPLKDTSIKKWFAGNKTAADNFLYSCAGWCVATFILGVCDRHNDNIMLTAGGHMFHIDFGKILGNAQMFGKVKRDRAPFIFTSEMESFITEEGKRPQRAQEFVDLCCLAYNMARKHSALIITLLELMLPAALPDLSGVPDLKYVHDNLRPYDTHLQATSYFTSKISESLQCVSVKLNFLIHAFANMTPADAARLPRTLRRTAAKILHKVGGTILNELGTLRDAKPPTAPDGERGIQLHFSFSPPIFSVLVKHLRHVYMSDGSAPCASVTISLHHQGREIARQKIRSQVRSSAPTFNKLVEFSVLRLDGLSMRFQVKSKGWILGELMVQLSGVPLQADVWYHLGG